MGEKHHQCHEKDQIKKDPPMFAGGAHDCSQRPSPMLFPGFRFTHPEVARVAAKAPPGRSWLLGNEPPGCRTGIPARRSQRHPASSPRSWRRPHATDPTEIDRTVTAPSSRPTGAENSQPFFLAPQEMPAGKVYTAAILPHAPAPGSRVGRQKALLRSNEFGSFSSGVQKPAKRGLPGS